MVKTKSAPAKKRNAAKGMSASAVRDIKPKSSKPAFRIQNVMDDAPKVEPLIDDSGNDIFQVNKMDIDYDQEDDFESVRDYEPARAPNMRVAPVGEEDDIDELEENDIEDPSVMEEVLPRDIIKVRFGTFVQLVANHDLDEVIEKNADQEIVMSSNLLTELAGSKDEREEKKIPLVFLVGIAIGVVLTYIFFSG